ncbi:MAG: hypothetical protein WA977_02875 [Halobacteriota archaeon]
MISSQLVFFAEWRCDSEAAKQLEEHFRCQAGISHRSPPCKFLGDCILQGAIDFAELRMRSGVGGEERNGIPRSTSQPTVQIFGRVHLQGAIDFAERSSGVGAAFIYYFDNTH